MPVRAAGASNGVGFEVAAGETRGGNWPVSTGSAESAIGWPPEQSFQTVSWDLPFPRFPYRDRRNLPVLLGAERRAGGFARRLRVKPRDASASRVSALDRLEFAPFFSTDGLAVDGSDKLQRLLPRVRTDE
jgi:hypothetical protein